MKTIVIAILSVAIVVSVLSGPGRLDFHGGRGGLRRYPPFFLQGLDMRAREEFFAIVTNNDLTIAEQKQAIQEWAQIHGILDQVENFRQKIEKIKSEMTENVNRLIADLPNAMQKISAIMENNNQTPSDRYFAIRKLREENPQLYRILKFAMQQSIPWNQLRARNCHQWNDSCREVLPGFRRFAGGFGGNQWANDPVIQHFGPFGSFIYDDFM